MPGGGETPRFVEPPPDGDPIEASANGSMAQLLFKAMNDQVPTFLFPQEHTLSPLPYTRAYEEDDVRSSKVVPTQN